MEICNRSDIYEKTLIHANELGYGFSEIGGNYDSASAKKPNAYRDDFKFNDTKIVLILIVPETIYQIIMLVSKSSRSLNQVGGKKIFPHIKRNFSVVCSKHSSSLFIHQGSMFISF